MERKTLVQILKSFRIFEDFFWAFEKIYVVISQNTALYHSNLQSSNKARGSHDLEENKIL
jgi:hypothetical protein